MTLFNFQDPTFERELLEEVERRRQRATSRRNTYTARQAANVARISERFPTLPREVATTAGIAGVDPENPALAQVNERAVQKEQSMWGRLKDAARGTVRGAFTAATGAFEEIVSRPFRTGLAAAEEAGISPTNILSGNVGQIGAELGRNIPSGRTQEFVRSLPETYTEAGPSAGAIALRQLREEGRADLGTGFFPGGTAQEEHLKRVNQLTYRGQPISPGRATAVQVFEPGTKPYNLLSGLVDASLQIFADPTVVATAGASKASKANKLFTGLLDDGARKTVLGQSVDGWLNSNDGRRLIEWVKDTDDFVKVRETLKLSDRKLALRLTDSTDEGEIVDTLRGALGTSIREKPVPTSLLSRATGTRTLGRQLGRAVAGDVGDIGGLKAAVRWRLQDTPVGRLVSDMPGRVVDVENMDEGLAELDDFMKAARIDPEDRAGLLRRMAELDDGDFDGTFGVVRDAVKHMEKNLLDEGVPAPAVEKVSDLFNSTEELRKYFIDKAGNPAWFPGAEAFDDDSVKATAQLLTEYLNRAVPLPDARELRRATNRVRQMSIKAADVGAELKPNEISRVMDKYMQKLWKPGVLLRLAWPVRVIGEEQVRLAASGLDGAFNHPLSWIAWATGKKGATDVLGASMDEALEHQAAMSNRAGGFLDRAGSGQLARAFKKVRKDESAYDSAWASNLAQLWSDEVAGRVAGGLRQSDDLTRALKTAGDETVVPVRFDPGAGDDIVEVAVPNVVNELPPPDAGKIRLYRGGKRGEHFSTDPATAIAFGESPARHGKQTGRLRYVDVDPDEVQQYRQSVEAVNDLTGAEAVTYQLPAQLAKQATIASPGRGPQFAPDSIDAVKEWFWDGGGAEFRDRLARSGGEAKKSALATREGADLYIDSVNARVHMTAGGDARPLLDGNPTSWSDPALVRAADAGEFNRIGYQIDANGHPDLVEAVGKKQLGDIDLSDLGDPDSRKWKQVTGTLRGYREHGPDVVKGSLSEFTPGADRTTYDRLVDSLFDHLMSKPTNKLSRSPAFKQFYWQRIEELAPFMTRGARDDALRAGRDAGLERETLRRIAGEAMEAGERGIDTLDDIDDIAKAFALEETRGLLYDLSKRHNIADITRHIFPFGEAWVEILSTWTKLIGENPRVLRRGQQIIEGARGSGFFAPDPTTGEETFLYPGGGLMADWMFGEDSPASMQTRGFVEGLNLVAQSFVPGFGPAVQVPVSMLMPDRPEYDGLRDLIIPFGPEKVSSPGDIADLGVPSWAEKVLIAVGSGGGDYQRIRANTTMDVYKAMLLSGQADDSTPQAAAESMRQAKDKAGYLSAIRGAAQFMLPTAPQIRFEARDEEGKWWQFQVLADAYREKLDETGDEQETFDWFINTFGLDPTVFTTAKSKTVQPRAVTSEGVDWERANKNLFETFPNTAYFAQPDDPDAEFDYTAYVRQLESGTRQPRTPEQWRAARNSTLGRILYEKARVKAEERGMDSGAKQWLRDYKMWLTQKYPGYGSPIVGQAERADTELMIEELRQWEDVPKLANSDAGQGLQLYLQAREEAQAKAEQMGLASYDSADKARGLRNYLRDYAKWVTSEHPDFAPMWRQIFERELTDDEEQPQPTEEAA